MFSSGGYEDKQTHVKPVSAILDHPLAFSGQLAKI